MPENKKREDSDDTLYPCLISCLYESHVHGCFSRFTVGTSYNELSETQSGVASCVFRLDYLDRNTPNLIQTKKPSPRNEPSAVDLLHYPVESPELENICLEENRVEYQEYITRLHQYRSHLTAELLDTPVTKFLLFFLSPRFRGSRFIAHAGKFGSILVGCVTITCFMFLGSRFDSIFVLNCLLKLNIKTVPLCVGSGYLQLYLPDFDIAFIDSYKVRMTENHPRKGAKLIFVVSVYINPLEEIQ